MIKNWVVASSAMRSGIKIWRPSARAASTMDTEAASEAVVVVVGSVGHVVVATVEIVVEEVAREDAELLLLRIRRLPHLPIT